jgi:MFS family permease
VIKEEPGSKEAAEYYSNEPEELSYSIRYRIFIFFLLANIFLNYDTGVIPASLLELIKEVQLDYKEQALIGSLVYLGLSFASLFVAPLFQKYGPAKVCAMALILNTLCCFVFSFSKLKYVLFGTRFLMGICEAFIVIYGPVWVNNYSPPENSAKWMGILHSCTALGVMIGYLFAAIIINFFPTYFSWRFAVQIQGIAQIPIALYFYLENESYINVDTSTDKNEGNPLDETFMSGSINLSKINADIRLNHVNSLPNPNENQIKNDSNNPYTPKKRHRSSLTNRYDSNYNPKSENRDELNYEESRNKRLNQQFSKNSLTKRKQFDKRIDTIETSNLSRYCSQARVVLCNPLYISVTLGLCSMYFIVSGIQFWMTSYLIDILGNNPIEVVIIFSTISITAPLAGVIVGGTFADRYGGYKGKNTLKALKLCLAFGVVAFVFSFPIGFLYGLVYITVLLWTFLFFGAAIVPVGTGIMVSSVRK